MGLRYINRVDIGLFQIMDGWIPTTRLKKGTYGFIKTKKR